MRSDELSWFDFFLDLDWCGRGFCNFDLLTASCAFRYRRAVKIFTASPGMELSGEQTSSSNLSDDSKLNRRSCDVRGAHRVAVHSSAIERREVYVGVDGFAQNAPQRAFELDRLEAQLFNALQYDGERLIDGDHEFSH